MRTIHAFSSPGYVLGNLLALKPREALIIGATLGQASKYRMPVSRVPWIKSNLPGGTKGALIGLGLDIATDPLTYLTLGTGAAARAGTRVALKNSTRDSFFRAGEETTVAALRAREDAISKMYDNLVAERGPGARLTRREVADRAIDIAEIRALQPRALTFGLRVPFGRGRFGRGQSVTFAQINNTPAARLRQSSEAMRVANPEAVFPKTGREIVADLLSKPAAGYRRLATDTDTARQMGNWFHAGGGMSPLARAMEQDMRRTRAVADADANRFLKEYTSQLRAVAKQLGRPYRDVSRNITFHLEDPLTDPLDAGSKKTGVVDADAQARLEKLAEDARVFFRQLDDTELEHGVTHAIQANYVPHMLRGNARQAEHAKAYGRELMAGDRGTRARFTEHRTEGSTLYDLMKRAAQNGDEVELDIAKLMQMRGQQSRRVVDAKITGDALSAVRGRNIEGGPVDSISIKPPEEDESWAVAGVRAAEREFDERVEKLRSAAGLRHKRVQAYMRAKAELEALREARAKIKHDIERLEAKGSLTSAEKTVLTEAKAELKANTKMIATARTALDEATAAMKEAGFDPKVIDARIEAAIDETGGARYGVAQNRPGLVVPGKRIPFESRRARQLREMREAVEAEAKPLTDQIAARERRIADLERRIAAGDGPIHHGEIREFMLAANARDQALVDEMFAKLPAEARPKGKPAWQVDRDRIAAEVAGEVRDIRQRPGYVEGKGYYNDEIRELQKRLRPYEQYARMFENPEPPTIRFGDEGWAGKPMGNNIGETPAAARNTPQTERGRSMVAKYLTPQHENLVRKNARREREAWRQKAEANIAKLDDAIRELSTQIESRRAARWSEKELMIQERQLAQLQRERELEALIADTDFAGGLQPYGKKQRAKARKASEELTQRERELGAIRLLNEEIRARDGVAVSPEEFDLARKVWSQVPETFRYHGMSDAEWQEAGGGIIRNRSGKKVKGVGVPRANLVAPEVARDMREIYDRIAPTINDNKAWNALVIATSHWKALALLSFGYHIRNQLDDGLRAYWGGARSPQSYWDALRIRRANGDSDEIIKLGRSGEMSWRQLYDIAENHGVIRTGQVNADIRAEGQRTVGAKTLRDRMPGRGGVVATSEAFGNAREDAMRMFFFIEMLKRGESTYNAARLTRTWLFDYGDVGKFVETARRFFLPFVTYPSKALPQTIKTFAGKPGIPANMAKIVDFLEVQANLTPEDLGNLPNYLEDAFIIPDMGPLSFLTGSTAGQPYVLDPSKVMGAASVGLLDPRPAQIGANASGMWSPLVNAGLTSTFGWDPFLNRKYGEGERVYAPAPIQFFDRLGVPIAGYGMKMDRQRGEEYAGYSPRLNALLNLIPVFGQMSRAVPSGREDAWQTGAFKFVTGLPVTPYDKAKAAFWADENRR
jgi:hypothetical protein